MASGKTDELKGRVKEAAGALTGDEKLKREGKADQFVGKVKQNVEKLIDKVKDAVELRPDCGRHDRRDAAVLAALASCTVLLAAPSRHSTRARSSRRASA